MGCGSSSTANNNAPMPDTLEPLLSLPYSLQSADTDIPFSFGPKIETVTSETVTTTVSIGDGTTLYLDCSSRGLVLRQSTNNNDNVIAVCKKVASAYNVYKLQPLWVGQNGDKSAKHTSPLYKYGTLSSNTQTFAYINNTPQNTYSTSYRVTDRKTLNGNNGENMYESYIRKTTFDGTKSSAAKWVNTPNDSMNHVKVFSSSSSSSSNNSIDIGLLVCLIAISDYKYVIDAKAQKNTDFATDHQMRLDARNLGCFAG